MLPDKDCYESTLSPRYKPGTEEKYRQAIAMYRTTDLSCAEISRICKVTVSGFRRYLSLYHCDQLQAQSDITCSKEETCRIKFSQLRRQLPAARAKYKDAIDACGSMDYIEFNVSQITREFGLDGTNLGRQLRTHYPEIIEWREKVRKRLGMDDNLPRGTRTFCKEQYAEAVKLLQGNSYITVQEAADTCEVSYLGLEQHLLFYHKELVKRCIKIREKAVRQHRKGEITGCGTVHGEHKKRLKRNAEMDRKRRMERQARGVEKSNRGRKPKRRNEVYVPLRFDNGDTSVELLTRSRYFIAQSRDKWTDSQKKRAEILFAQYPDLLTAYSLVNTLRNIFKTKSHTPESAAVSLKRWYANVEKSGFKTLINVADTIESRQEHVVNYFKDRHTNASAKSLNSKIKGFRSMLRGVSDLSFFMYRVSTIFG